MNMSTDSLGFYWASSALTAVAALSAVTAATLIWVMLI